MSDQGYRTQISLAQGLGRPEILSLSEIKVAKSICDWNTKSILLLDGLGWEDSLDAEVQPRQDQEYPRDEWHRRGRRQTHTEGCVEEVAFFYFKDSSVFIEWTLPPP